MNPSGTEIEIAGLAVIQIFALVATIATLKEQVRSIQVLFAAHEARDQERIAEVNRRLELLERTR